ncbi:glycoside hydrolase family 38 N-terminal domain-containing protein [Silvibacterium acidisoli]|uniref:glycoside hydrolase family 38 N-terminal domain-containing protein n=1 Tax=Acidobacteriaceae bacterium ZG23-2 TaxID=2883246 RepID=UPI00406C5785
MESVPQPRRRTALHGCLIAACSLFMLAPVAVAATDSSAQIKTVYIIPSSHWDYGFVDTPEGVRRRIKPHIDAVMAACDADPQFRWTIESVWQLQAWLEQTKDPAQIQHLADLMHKGQIELSAAYGSMHTEFMGSEELNRLVSSGQQVEQRFGVHPTVAMMNDVPGFSMRLPQVFARSGIKYFITGSNIALGGGAALWPGKVPFYWKSPDGSGVLVWQTQGKNGGYTEGMADFYLAPQAEDPYEHTKFYPKEWKGLPDLEIMQRGIDKMLKQYADAGYQHHIAAVFFMHDAVGPDLEAKYLLPSVRAWNAAGKLPHLVVATPSEFFAHLESDGGSTSPAYMGDWSGLWAEVKVNSPAMSADARFLQERIPQTETLWSLLKMQHMVSEYPGKTFDTGYNDLFQYDEHNGAGQGGWPDVLTKEQVFEQNREYSEWLRSGRESTSKLFDEGLEELAPVQSSGQVVLAYNPQSWTRSQLVKVSPGAGSWNVRDASTGELIPSQRLASDELYFEAKDVPSEGYRTYRIESATSNKDASSSSDGAALESPYFKVELDSKTGNITRITDLRAQRVIVDHKDGGAAGELMLNDSAYEAPADSAAVLLRHDRGPVVDRLVISRPGSLWPETTITLPQAEPVVRIDQVLDRSRMPFVADKQRRALYSFAFNFSVHGKAEHWIDNGAGLYRFPDELLPGARKDGVVPRHTLVWDDNGSYQLMLTQKQSFYDRLRTHTASSDQNLQSTDGVLIDAMIKHDEAKTKDTGVTSFETYEPGYPKDYTFSFALTGQAGPVDPVSAHRFTVPEDSDAIELSPGRGASHPTASLLSLSAANVVVEALRPSSDGNANDYLLRLRELSGKATDLSLTLPVKLAAIAETNLTEDSVIRTGLRANAIHISPHQTLTLRLSVAHSAGATSGEIK